MRVKVGVGVRPPVTLMACVYTTWFNVRDYGAVGDGQSNDSAAIQEAIDRCAANGGGTVLVPAGGAYLTGQGDL